MHLLYSLSNSLAIVMTFFAHVTQDGTGPVVNPSIIKSTLLPSGISKQQTSETQSLMDREAQLISYQHKDLHQRKEATKEKTQTALAGRQKVNEMTKKFMKTE